VLALRSLDRKRGMAEPGCRDGHACSPRFKRIDSGRIVRVRDRCNRIVKSR
jgi:hypothetical protein